MARSDRRAAAILVALTACYTPPSAAPFTPAEVASWSAGPTAPRASNAQVSWDLDVEAAVAYAMRNGPTARARRTEEAIAEAEIGAAGQLTNPELRVGRSTESSVVGATDRVVIALRLHPDMPWARDAKVAAARADLAAEHARSGSAQREVAAEIRRLYAALAFGEATRDVITKQLGVLAERQRVLAAQVARGTATQLEAILSDEDALDLEATRGTLEVELARSRSALSTLIGAPHGQTWKPVWDLEALRAVTTTFDRSALRARALAARPELAEAAHRVQAADARAYRERARRVPWFENVQVERSVKDSVDWAISLAITVPLFSLNGGEIDAADARTRSATEARRQLALQTLQDVDTAIAIAETTGKRAKELADRVGPLDQALSAVMTQTSSAGIADPVKMLLLEERHVRAERKVLEAALDHRLAVIALLSLTEDATWR